MQKNELIILYGTAYKEMTRQILKEADLASLIGNRKARIGLKPNLVNSTRPDNGGTTHTEVVEGALEYLQENGFTDLVMLEGSWVGDNTQDAIRNCGYDKVSRKYGVPFIDLQKDKSVPLNCGGMKLNVCEQALSIDFLINIPVLKGHCQTGMTCALKNLKGLLPNSEKRRFHRMGLHDPIGHLSAGIHQDFILVDSICGDLAYEDGGKPVRQDRIMAALDPVLCDAWACGIVGLAVDDVPYVRIAERLGIGSADLTGARIRQLRWDDAKGALPIEAASDDGVEPGQASGTGRPGGFNHVLNLATNVEAVDSCSACYAYLIPALEKLEKEGLLERLDTKIAIGQGFRGKTGEIGVGNCTKKFAHSLPGCPPLEGEIYSFLKKYILSVKK